MENITVNGNAVTLETLRHNVAEAVKRAYGAEREYAVALNTMFASFDWFEVEANDVRDEAKPVHAEKLALYKELKGANHSNPSTVWARIRKYGKEEKYGKPEAKGAEGAEGEGEGEGAGNTARDPMTRNIDELLALYKFNARQEELNDKVKNAQVHIVYALKALGVNLDLVK